MRSALRPDGFALGLLIFGMVMFFVPLMKVAGLIAMVASAAYWFTMVVVRVSYRRRA